MTNTSPLKDYLQKIQSTYATGDATEHSHRSTLEALLEALGDDIQAINEPRRIECGAPDLAVLKDKLLVGHVEAKDIGKSLDTIERSEQLTRYRQSLGNLILTDYLAFRWYVDGDLRRTARLARLDVNGQITRESGGRQNVSQLLSDFLAHTPEPIGTPQGLAERMARLTHLIRDIIVTAFEKDKASDLLQDWRTAFAEVLVEGLDEPENVGQFADMFAQTLAYGLFSARVRHERGPFTRQRAQDLIPETNPFLREFFYYITGPKLENEPYAGLVEDLVQVLNHADMHEILADFGRRTRQDDPTVHFYETFLAAYDPRLRERRGVYYTPNPVVSYIVRSVDALLKSEFNLPDGLADTTKVDDDRHKVLILDPACGTATFLYHVIALIREEFMLGGNAGMWSSYVRDHLLPRIFGFELLMAPYAVAHFKLALQLAGHDLSEAQQEIWGYDFANDERLGVYLTNTLEAIEEEIESLWGPLRIVTEEAQHANQVKRDLPIMVVLGNPPYSGHSANKGEWIDDLLHGRLPSGEKGTSYYEVDGHRLRERNTKWLQDDYVKFIRFGQWRIEKSGGGVVAYISNNGYLDNPTFRGMRQSLMETFSEIYILDLHGNARKKETAPDGSPDENVFDIMQGVAIGIFVKDPEQEGLAKIYHADLWGRRESKYRLLQEYNVENVEWEELKPQAPFYLFIPRDIALLDEYQNGWKVVEAFPKNSVGIVTARDSFTIHWTSEAVWQTVNVTFDRGEPNRTFRNPHLRVPPHLRSRSSKC